MEQILKTGAQFSTKDNLGRIFRYEVVGIDLHDIMEGTGCGGILLKDLADGAMTCVEAEWFRQREITNVNNMRNSIEVPCSAGILCAEAGGDPDYPGVFTYLRREDGLEVDLCSVEGDGIIPDGLSPAKYDGQTNCNGGIRAFVYENTQRDEPTDGFFFTKEALSVEYPGTAKKDEI